MNTATTQRRGNRVEFSLSRTLDLTADRIGEMMNRDVAVAKDLASVI